MARIDLAGKPIAITGASSGIGAATALECAKAGMPVALAARRADKLEAVRKDITDAGGTAIVVECDVTKPDDCQRLFDETKAAFGSVYAVFANAGYGEKRSVLDSSDSDIREMFETNFIGTLNTIRPALPAMIEAGSGHVLMCSSCLSVFTPPNYGAYSATKASQHHLGRAMAVELAGTGVQVSTVHPVGTSSEFFDTMNARTDGARTESSRSRQPPRRVARAVVNGLTKPKPEIWTSFFARHGMIAAAHTPRLTKFVLGRMGSA